MNNPESGQQNYSVSVGERIGRCIAAGGLIVGLVLVADSSNILGSTPNNNGSSGYNFGGQTPPYADLSTGVIPIPTTTAKDPTTTTGQAPESNTQEMPTTGISPSSSIPAEGLVIPSTGSAPNSSPVSPETSAKANPTNAEQSPQTEGASGKNKNDHPNSKKSHEKAPEVPVAGVPVSISIPKLGIENASVLKLAVNEDNVLDPLSKPLQNLSKISYWYEQSEIGMVRGNNEKGGPTGTAYLLGHDCLNPNTGKPNDAAAASCIGNYWSELRKGDAMYDTDENGVTWKLVVQQNPVVIPKDELPKTEVFDYNHPGYVWAITCARSEGQPLRADGHAANNVAILLKVVGFSTPKSEE